ncbi:MAG: acetylornithine/succinylornithine family transaminase [Pirellulaceae bacterium]|nr:acetylornithine/succinylornithine family transaminase [Pirellulaceae bacterium]
MSKAVSIGPTNKFSTQETIDLFEKYVVPNYRREPVNFVRGHGSEIWDDEGTRYLDFFPGWGCNLLGHCPPKVVQAVQQQVAQLIHVPNNWLIDLQGYWAKLLSDRSFGGQAFFCNSGAEANEAAIKLARLHHQGKRYKIITFLGGFHGRTLGALTATAQPQYHENLGPLVAGFRYAPLNDLQTTEELIDDETSAIMVEPIQGEGGVHLPKEGFLQGLRELANRHDLLLIFDEVQTGCGRLGEWFGYQHFGVEPDVITLAKSLCGGIVGGAMLAKSEIAKSLIPGMHATTFGGNPVAAAAGIATIQTIEEENLLARGRQISQRLEQKLTDLASRLPIIEEVRIAGLMVGIQLATSQHTLVAQCQQAGLLINCTQGNILRLLPALNLTDEQCDEGLNILEQVLIKAQEATTSV